jgi:capsular exopolysaccharide synthesis family protein
MEARWKMTQHTGEWLSRQLDDMRISLERSEDNLQAYARKAGLLFTTTNDSDRTNVSEDKLRQVQEELSKAQADRVSAQSKYEIAKAAAPDTLADVLNDASLRTLQQRITELRQQEADLSIIYTPKSEKIQRILSQIGPLQQALERERTDILDRIHHDYESAMRREQLLLSDYANQSHVVTDQAEKTVQYNILKREVDSNRQIYEAMLQQVKQASVASAMRASNVRTVDPAKVPTKQYSPDYLINSALGLLSGCLLGVGFVIMRERSNKTIQQPGDMPFWLNVPELGVIPSATMETRRRIAYAKPKQIDGSVAANGNGSKRHGDKTQDVALVTHNSKPSLIAESFRAVLTSILFSGDNGTRPRVLMLTSASPVEGKTTLVSNLGIAMAEIGRKVLIIDADLRRPRMHVLFELPNETGLSTLLQDRTFSDESLNGIIHETAIPGLSVLPAGPSTHAAANLLYSTVFPEMLTLLRKQFDTVIIDTPPMLQMTDARVVGRLADAVILVTRAGKTTREAAMAAYQRFAEDKTRVLGTILNDWNPKTAPGGYYGYYNGYGHSYKNYNGYYTAGSKN